MNDSMDNFHLTDKNQMCDDLMNIQNNLPIHEINYSDSFNNIKTIMTENYIITWNGFSEKLNDVIKYLDNDVDSILFALLPLPFECEENISQKIIDFFDDSINSKNKDTFNVFLKSLEVSAPLIYQQNSPYYHIMSRLLEEELNSADSTWKECVYQTAYKGLVLAAASPETYLAKIGKYYIREYEYSFDHNDGDIDVSALLHDAFYK